MQMHITLEMINISKPEPMFKTLGKCSSKNSQLTHVDEKPLKSCCQLQARICDKKGNLVFPILGNVLRVDKHFKTFDDLVSKAL